MAAWSAGSGRRQYFAPVWWLPCPRAMRVGVGCRESFLVVLGCNMVIHTRSWHSQRYIFLANVGVRIRLFPCRPPSMDARARARRALGGALGAPTVARAAYRCNRMAHARTDVHRGRAVRLLRQHFQHCCDEWQQQNSLVERRRRSAPHWGRERRRRGRTRQSRHVWSRNIPIAGKQCGAGGGSG